MSARQPEIGPPPPPGELPYGSGSVDGKGDAGKECTVRTAKYGKLQENAVKTGDICGEKGSGGTGLGRWRQGRER